MSMDQLRRLRAWCQLPSIEIFTKIDDRTYCPRKPPESNRESWRPNREPSDLVFRLQRSAFTLSTTQYSQVQYANRDTEKYTDEDGYEEKRCLDLAEAVEFVHNRQRLCEQVQKRPGDRRYEHYCCYKRFGQKQGDWPYHSGLCESSEVWH